MQASRTTLIGRLAADPLMLPNTTGDEKKDRCWCRVITNRRFGDKLDAHPVLFWGKQARAVAEHCSKGKEVYIEGESHVEAREVKDASGNVLVKADGKPLMTNYYEIGATYISFGANSKKRQDELAAAQGVVASPAPAAIAAAPATGELTPQMQELVARTAAAIVARQQAEQAAANHSPVDYDDPIPYTAG
jgi:single-stranded DNA-binding protein